MFVSTHYASKAGLAVPEVAREVIRGVGYSKDVFDADACAIMTSFMDHTATDYRRLNLDDMDDADIGRLTAKHQATVFGYACDQTAAMMPLPIWLAHRLADKLDDADVSEALPYLLPDGKSQVAIEYRGGEPSRIHSITLVASQTTRDAVSPSQLQDDLITRVVEPVLKTEGLKADEGTKIHVNPEGPLVGGGPAAHSGLTGRKTGIDTYGEYARQSGTALSGKDPMRIDRVGAYIARYAAKNVVAAGLARECEVQLSYAIGVPEPVSIRVRSFGTGTVDEDEIRERLVRSVDFRPAGIVRDLGLRKLPAQHPEGFYRRLAVYGHMGRTDLDVPWERTDKVDALK
jgi:S-adenosylmethionine synthetase